MDVIVDKSWANWESVIDGDGAASVNADKVLSVSGSIGSRSYRRLFKAIKPGQTYRFSVRARLISSTGDTLTDPGIFVDWPDTGSLATYINIDSTQWKRYEITYTTPPETDPEQDCLAIACGVISSTGGAAEFLEPKIEAINGVEMPGVWACGLFEIDTAGNVTLVESSPTTGINSFSYNAPDLELDVDGVDPQANIKPVPTAFMTTFGPDSYIAKASSTITGNENGKFNVKILDTATGNYLAGNPSSNTRIYVEVRY